MSRLEREKAQREEELRKINNAVSALK